MATTVRFAIPEREIGNNGVTFGRKTDAGKHGSIMVRQNHLEWLSAGDQYLYQVTWEDFAQFAEDRGRRLRPKKTAVKARTKLAA